MDRLIVTLIRNNENCITGLKSNMDRFIVVASYVLRDFELGLKSNMDRFIGAVVQVSY